jgi:hypothetical protein
MFLAIDKFENWITVGIMFAVWILTLHLLAKAGVHIGGYLGLQDD